MGTFESIQGKIKTREAAKAQIQSWKAAAQKVVFTNGCFDLLHQGHVTYLAKASDLGHKMVLGLNADASVKRLGKGDDRPINGEDARALVLASLSFIDLVVVFDEDTPLELIQTFIPDVLVKGGDYDPNETDPTSKTYIVGSDIVKGNGGSVQVVNLVEGFSTTGIINKMK